MKVVQIIKYILMAADLVGMAGLFYAGINTFINFTIPNTNYSCTGTVNSSGASSTTCSGSSTTHRSVQDVIWGIYYIFVVAIGIYLIILGVVHVTYGFYTVNHCLSLCVKLCFVQWRKKPAPSSQDKYETGMNQPAGQQNNAAASDNAQKAQPESAKKKKAKETTKNEQQEPPQDNQAADNNNINLSARKKGAKTKKGYELDEEEA